MAIDIKFDLAGNPEPPTIILANRNGDKLGQLKVNTESINLSDKFNDVSEISFTVNKFVDGEIIPLWDKIVDFKLIYCKEWDIWFEIEVELDEETESVKTVLATQLGYAELSQIMLYNIEINTEKDIERDDYKITILYDPEDSSASLLDRIFEKAPHYSVVYIDDTIKNIQRSFSFDDSSIVDACQEIAEEIGCFFEFHSNSDDKGMPQRTVSVHDLYQSCNNCDYRGEFTDRCPECGSTDITPGYGVDTTIFVTSDELASNGIEFTTDVDEVKNCFKLEAGDDLMTATIRNCNPNGTDYIWYFSDSLKENMSDELVKKLDGYDKLYKDYYESHESKLNDDLVDYYNDTLVKKYEGYYNTTSTCVNCDYKGMFVNACPKCNSTNILSGKILQSIPETIIGYSSLMNAYYNVIDLGWYLKSGLMPTVKMSKTSAQEQANLLSFNIPYSVAVADASIASEATANSAVLGMARIIVKSTYKVEIKSSEYDKNTKTWRGVFLITNYSDEEDWAEVTSPLLTITSDLESFVKQKIEKALNKEDTDDLSITGLFKKDISDFETELKNYALVPLNSFYDACQSCIDILIEQGIAEDESSDLYIKLYEPYYEKLLAIEAEIQTREYELNAIIGEYDINGNLISKGLQQEIEEHRNAIQKALNFQNYMGEKLWLEFCAHRREDKYSNNNYISDGLNNAELFSKALDFHKVAKNEIYKSAELLHSISAILNNLLAIEKFKPLIKSFKVGNWLRVRVDDNVYKLRLLEYEIDFADFDNIPVKFSDMSKIKDGVTDVESVLSQASSMASSYDALTKQANRGDEARSAVREWLTEGLNTALVQIQNNVNEDIVIDKNGLLGRSYSEITEKYSPEQIRLTHNIIAFTDNNWKTVKQAIGKHKYKYFDKGKDCFVDTVGYGVSSDFVIGGVISGSQIISGEIYSDNYSKENKKGSYLDLRTGNFSFGGGKITFNGTELTVNPDNDVGLTAEQVTKITNDTISTTNVIAKDLQVDAANVSGTLKANKINASELVINAVQVKGQLTIGNMPDDVATKGNVTTIIEDTIDTGYITSLGLKVGEHIQMGENAVISWDNIDGKPDNIPDGGDIPTKVSDLENDSGYQTATQVTTITQNTITTDYINSRIAKIGQWNIGTTPWMNLNDSIYATASNGDYQYLTFIRNDGYPQDISFGVIRAERKASNIYTDTDFSNVFYIKNNGELFCSNADITGKISAASGSIGNWKIDGSGSLCSTDGEYTSWINQPGRDAKGTPLYAFAVLKGNTNMFVVDTVGRIRTVGNIESDGEIISEYGIQAKGYGILANGYSSEKPTSGRIIASGGIWAKGKLAADAYGLEVAESAYIHGNLTVKGDKNRLVTTENYGQRLLYCYEVPSPMFGDIGEGQLDELGKCYVFLDDVFAETIDTDCIYQVFLQPYGKGECYVTERTPSYFVVEGTKSLSFGWEIKAIQKDFDTMRLEECNIESMENEKSEES